MLQQKIECKERCLEMGEVTLCQKCDNLPMVFERIRSNGFGQDESLEAFVLQERLILAEKLENYGALLFRGFDVSRVDLFEKSILAFGFRPEENYVVGVTPRRRIGNFAYSSTEAPSIFTISSHTEMCYQPIRPGVVAFWCDVEPTEFGETPIFDCAGIVKSLPFDLVDKLEKKDLRYDRFFGRKTGFLNFARTWMSSFDTNDPKEVEEICRKMNSWFYWEDDGSLRTQTTVPAFTIHPVTGQRCLNVNLFHEDAYLYDLKQIARRYHPAVLTSLRWLIRRIVRSPKAFCLTRWGDGTELSTVEVRAIQKAVWDNATVFRWRKGDVLVIDNILVSHARLNVIKPRRIGAMLADSYDVRICSCPTSR